MRLADIDSYFDNSVDNILLSLLTVDCRWVTIDFQITYSFLIDENSRPNAIKGMVDYSYRTKRKILSAISITPRNLTIKHLM